MDKELEESLRHIQSHPTTGTPHNQQLISTQVEAIFAIDRLHTGIRKLIKTIIALDRKNDELERSNFALQKQMLLLTAVATVIAVFQFLQAINFTSIMQKAFKLIPSNLLEVITILISLIVGVLTFYLQRLFLGYMKEEDEFLKSALKDIRSIKTKVKKLTEQEKNNKKE